MEQKLLEIIPKDKRKTYKMRKILDLILDMDSFFEMIKDYGPSLITGLARLNGFSVAILLMIACFMQEQ